MRSFVIGTAERILNFGKNDVASKQSGKTHALVEICMKRSGILVARDVEHAEYLKYMYPKLQVIDVSNLRNQHENIYVDHAAYEKVIRALCDDLRKMSMEIEKLKGCVSEETK